MILMIPVIPRSASHMKDTETRQLDRRETVLIVRTRCEQKGETRSSYALNTKEGDDESLATEFREPNRGA